jgi:cytochrome P450
MMIKRVNITPIRRNLLKFFSTASDATPTRPAAQPFDKMPGPQNELPILGSLLDFIKAEEGYHMYFHDLHKQYGDVVKCNIMGDVSVSVCRPDHIKEAYLLQQSTPLRESLLPWVMWRKSRNVPLGVTMQLSQFDQDEAEWRKYRRPIANLLKPDLVKSYVSRVSHVACDLSDSLRQTQQQPVNIAELRNLTSAFGFEAISAILMGKHMGVLGSHGGKMDPATFKLNRDFMDAVDNMFLATNKMIFKEFPFWRWLPTTSRNSFYASMDTIFSFGAEIFADRTNNRDERYKDDGATDFFDLMIDDSPESITELTQQDKEVMGVELIAAGVDTTSNAAQWILLMMAQRPEVQERLAASIRSVLGAPCPDNPSRLTPELLQELKLYTFVDEVMRLHPVLPQGNRMFDKEVELFGYRIPPFTSIRLNNWTASRDERNFDKPDDFDETRSVRRECPFGNKTFGAGARQCECTQSNHVTTLYFACTETNIFCSRCFLITYCARILCL